MGCTLLCMHLPGLRQGATDGEMTGREQPMLALCPDQAIGPLVSFCTSTIVLLQVHLADFSASVKRESGASHPIGTNPLLPPQR
jgi:hypothetical protein